jgi:acyl-homoserine lactone acylase PvdQ
VHTLDTKRRQKADYKSSPWLKLLNSYADGINYYLYKHKLSPPFHFEPWFPLLWTDSIGASTAGLSTGELKSILLWKY